MTHIIAFFLILWLLGGALKTGFGLAVHLLSAFVIFCIILVVIGALGYFLLYVVLPVAGVVTVVALIKRH